MSNTTVKIEWKHVISIDEFDDHLEFLDNNIGIYLWIYQGTPKIVSYIGITEKDSFAGRFFTHFSNQLSGKYTVSNVKQNNNYADFYIKNISNKHVSTLIGDNNIYWPTQSKGEKRFYRSFVDKSNRELFYENMINHRYAFGLIKSEQNVHYKKVECALMLEYVKNIESKYNNGNRISQLGARSNYKMVGSISRYLEREETYIIEHEGEAINDIPSEITTIMVCKG